MIVPTSVTIEDMIALEEELGMRTTQEKRRYHMLQINILKGMYDIVTGEDVKSKLDEELSSHQRRLDMLLSYE